MISNTDELYMFCNSETKIISVKNLSLNLSVIRLDGVVSRSDLSFGISVAILVLVSHGKLLRVILLDLFVSHLLTHTLKLDLNIIPRVVLFYPVLCVDIRDVILQRRSRSGLSTARKGLPEPRPSVLSF